jgi:hypothetical protein
MDWSVRRPLLRNRLGRVLVPLACLLLLLGACTRQSATTPEPWTPSASPVPTSTAGCGLQELPASWQAALKPTTVTPTTDVDLFARDATTGRALYVRVGPPMAIDHLSVLTDYLRQVAPGRYILARRRDGMPWISSEGKGGR